MLTSYLHNLASGILILPMLSFICGLVLQIIFPQDRVNKYISISTTCLILCTAICSWILNYALLFQSAESFNIQLFPWITLDNYNVYWSISINSISSLMLTLIATVSFFVHLYSIEYMHEEKDISRFMINISFFTFAMIMLVTSDNLLQLFFGWEGVGVASYLLIGFYHKKHSANIASMKAFIVNRIADMFMIFGIGLIFYHFKTINFSEFLNYDTISQIDQNIIDLICISLFIGCMGKSAQIILHTWLPDAMEGPTPVSALIHAATMVTAGVFLVCKCAILFDASTFTREIILYVGAITALFGASCALVQNDIKKIIAYSTCSQLGYMFMACGAQFYTGSIMHLLTHGFFKALLFLCAGSVIHGLHHEQDIRNMGGIRKKMPITFFAIIIGTVAISGIPPFAGYYSKDSIIESLSLINTFGGHFSHFIADFVAYLTCFYSFRLIYIVFFGDYKGHCDHISESKINILTPLILLGILSTISGYFMINFVGFKNYEYNTILSEIGSIGNTAILTNLATYNTNHLTLLFVIFGFITATIFYISKPSVPKIITTKFNCIYNILLKKWHFDEIYNIIFVKNYIKISNYLASVFDFGILNHTLVIFPSKKIFDLSFKTRIMQSGSINLYTTITIVTIIGLIVICIN